MINKEIIRGIYAFIIFSASCLYYQFSDYLPPETARKMARKVTLVDIPFWGCDKVRFERPRPTLNGDGETRVVLKFSENSFNQVEQQCLRDGYRPMTSKAKKLLYVGGFPIAFDKCIYKFIRPPDYNNPTGYTLVVLDKVNKTLIIYMIYV